MLNIWTTSSTKDRRRNAPMKSHQSTHPVFSPSPRPIFLQSVSLPLLVVVLALLCGMTHGKSPFCPEECSCFGDFVSCQDFTEDTLLALPHNVNTLVLHRGTINSFPRSFLQRLPKLSFLEVQSTDVKTIVGGTFSHLKQLDQLAFVQSRVGTIETGAFADIQNVSQVLIYESQIGTVQPGAFSELEGVGELKIWSTSIEDMKDKAFDGISDIGSFAFYLNNVTKMASKAFHKVQNLDKVKIRQNRFTYFQASAVVPLTEASRENDISSNILSCQCQVFQRPEMLQLVYSQTCFMPESGQVFNVSEVNVTELCISQSLSTASALQPTSPRTNPTTFSRVGLSQHTINITTVTQTYPSTASVVSAFSKHATAPRMISSPASKETGEETSEETSSIIPLTLPQNVTESPTSSTSIASDNSSSMKISRMPPSHTNSDLFPEETTQNGGRMTDSFLLNNGVMSGKRASFVALIFPFIVVTYFVKHTHCHI